MKKILTITDSARVYGMKIKDGEEVVYRYAGINYKMIYKDDVLEIDFSDMLELKHEVSKLKLSLGE